MLNGWLIINKPVGMTSTLLGNIIRRKLKIKKLGHAGTLDPFASGVLPLALGEATKSMPYLAFKDKGYIFDLTFGEQRDSDDREGQVVATNDHVPTEAEIRAVLPQFTGIISQIPPIYSAIHIDGKRAYARARAGEEFTMPARQVEIISLEFLEMLSAKTARLAVHCGSGTYVRALGRDIATALGTLGYLEELQRSHVGRFSLNDAISVDNALKTGDFSDITHEVKSIRSVLDDIPAVPVSISDVDKIRNGQPILAPTPSAAGDVFLLLNESKEIALAKLEDGYFHPIRVFNI